MTSALAHTGRAPRKCWDENQYRLLHAAIAPALTSGKSLLSIVHDAMSVHIAPNEHRNITAAVAKQVWVKAQQAVGVLPSAPLAPAPAPAAMPVVMASSAPTVVKLSPADAVKLIPSLKAGTLIELL